LAVPVVSTSQYESFSEGEGQPVMLEQRTRSDSPIPYLNVDEELDEEEEEEENGKMLPPPAHDMEFKQQRASVTVSSTKDKKSEECALPGKCNEATMVDRPSPKDDPEQFKLANDLYDVRGAITSHTKGIATEENWIQQVQEILKTYAGKVQKVQDHIQIEHKMIKDLIKKRREIKRKQKEMMLQSQLKSASEDLKVLQGQLGQVKERENEFDKLKSNLKDKVTQLETELKKLQIHDAKDDSQKKKKEEAKKEEHKEKEKEVEKEEQDVMSAIKGDSDNEKGKKHEKRKEDHGDKPSEDHGDKSSGDKSSEDHGDKSSGDKSSGHSQY